MTLWAAQILSALTKFAVRRTNSAPGGRGSPAPRRHRPSCPQASRLVQPVEWNVHRQANHQRRRQRRNGVQPQKRRYSHAASWRFPEMTPFPTLPGRKLARPRGRRLRSGLLDVEVARPSPSRRLQSGSLHRSFESPEKFDGFWRYPAGLTPAGPRQNGQSTNFQKILCQNDRRYFKAFGGSTPPNLSF
jgi:hypothetical protein